MKQDLMNLQSFIVKMADGNIGALSMIMDIMENHVARGLVALQRMEMLDIKGEKLYLIWNDCCFRDLNKTLDVMLERSKAEILDHIDMQKNWGRGKPFEEVSKNV